MLQDIEPSIIPVDNRQLQQLLAKGVALVDVRRPEEWQASGVIRGSLQLTFFDAGGACDPAAWLDALGKQVPPGKPLALICRSGQRTGRIAAWLRQEGGYPTIYDACEGMLGWLAENLPVVATATADA